MNAHSNTAAYAVTARTRTQVADEGMPKINRRSFIGKSAAVAAIPAMGLAQIVPAEAEELPVTRAHRLADELAHAMDDWMADLDDRRHAAGGQGYSHWIAHIHPASFAQYPVMFENSRARRPSKIMTLFEKWNALRNTVDAHDGKDGEEFQRLYDECNDVMAQVMSLPPLSVTDFAAKLSCLTHYGAYDELAGDKWGFGSALIREAAELVGHPEHVVQDHLAGAS